MDKPSQSRIIGHGLVGKNFRGLLYLDLDGSMTTNELFQHFSSNSN